MSAMVSALRTGSLVAGLALAACAGASQQAIDAAAAQHRQAGFIRPGDTMEYVRLQWRPPSNVRTSSYAGGRSEWWDWCYESLYYANCHESVYFVDGKVRSIHQR